MIYLNPKDRLKKEETTLSPTSVSETSVVDKITVKELRAMCKDKGLTGYSKLKEAELIELLGL